jgi:hypothetical protein
MRHLFAYSGAIFQKDPGPEGFREKGAGIFAAECEGSSDFCHVPWSEARGVRTLRECEHSRIAGREISSSAAETMSIAMPFRFVSAHPGEIHEGVRDDAWENEFLS